ncbi:tetratricopeptide repeat protein [Lentzea aerocolonigenes]|uniref:tetratricopeptide repeat protein n=1 Tax=Lentzea aerocolonigenes TaxID=68170 RepID=UPI001F2BC655|nr:tetratricopeptide repeat protein [Lentzea aerocolonigenes]
MSPALSRFPASTEQFVGRSTELQRLDDALAQSGRAAVVAVHGLGGVGKSTLSSEFVRLHAQRYSVVWWITADSPTAIDTGLADMVTTFAPHAADLPLEQRTELAVQWLATHDGWLLVLDNLTTPGDVAGLLERVRSGAVLITSRQGTGWRGVTTVSLDVLSPQQAEELLSKIVRLDWPSADLTGASELCEELGWLPLAVEQAAAYIGQAHITPGDYLELLKRYPARMFTATAEGGDAQRTMARVWHVTLDRLADTPLAGRLLRHLAWYAPDGIPRAFLALQFEEPDLTEALGRLAAHSMITLGVDTISVHRLIQAVSRTPDPDDRHRLPEDVAASRDAAWVCLAEVLKELDARDPAAWPAFRLVLPHIRAIFANTSSDDDSLEACWTLNELARFVENQGDVATSISYKIRALSGYERLCGSEDQATLIMRNNLAYAYKAVGDLDRAIPLLELTLADTERLLGADHPETLNQRGNLASCYGEKGGWTEAIPLMQSVRADRERVLGPDHPQTLRSRNNLAHAYQASGDQVQAIELYETNLGDYERVLGADHPETLFARNNLACAYADGGQTGRAARLLEAVLEVQNRVLGPEHPDTLVSAMNFASARASTGDLEQAIRLLESVLATSERVLGPDHKRTRVVRDRLSEVLEKF